MEKKDLKDLIEGSNLSKIYQSGGEQVKALNNLNLTIENGEFVALMGPSGSGKSTLLTILGALNPPTYGTVFIDGINIYNLSTERRADFRSTYMGFVFQQFHLIPYLSAVENVMLPLAISSKSSKEQTEKAQGLLEKVGLGNKLKRLPNELSGGEQERVAIARALVNDPPIVFADEPTGALDAKTSLEIMELFQKVNEENYTIIMVTHNKENLDFVKRAVFIRDGEIEAEERY